MKMPGNVLYRKIVGKNSVSDNAEPLREDAVLKMGSATKFMTSVALLQCVEKGLIGLDEPISRVLPELQGKPILEGVEGSKLVTRPSTAEISARHLITHMSGLGYWFTHPLLMKWRQSYPGKDSNRLTERFNYPLVFEPGQGWLYGNSLDWAGVAVSRLNGGISLENYMIENMWKRVGRSAPYPTFHVSKHPDYEARLMKAAKRTSTGGLEPSTGPMFQVGLEDDEGGAGLVLTMDDYLAILQDLVSDTPNLLKPEMISMMLEPQIPNESSTKQMLLQGKPAWDMVTGPCKDEDVNHGLGGALVLAEVPEIGQPKNIL